MNKIITQINNSIFAVKAENTIQLMYEQELELKIANIFHQMLKEVLINLEEFYSEDVMFNAHMDLILSPIHEAHKEYFELIMEYKNREYNRGLAQAKRLVRRARNQYYTKTGAIKASIDLPLSANLDKGKLFGTDDFSAEYMANKTFVASERTLERVDSDINKIITEGYRDGKGINDVGQRIEKRFNQLKDWESRRIARTEIHGSHMQGIMQGYQDMDVQYTQWSTAHDSRVRGTNPADKADHVKMDGEIIPMGGVYSNGLKYPGDTDGPLREFINCRCGNLPFIMPPGYAAPPGRSHFRESDLVKIEDVNIEDKLLQEPEQLVIENPTAQQLKDNLSKDELKKYREDKEMVDWAYDVMNNPNMGEKQKNYARNRLNDIEPRFNQLKQKALGNSVKPVVDTPIKTPKKTPLSKGTKPKSPSKELSTKELYESMTKTDKKKYDKIKKQLENTNKNLEQIGENQILLDMKKKQLLELRKLEEKQRDKLLKKTKPKSRKKLKKRYERDLDNIYEDIELPVDELIPTLEKWIDKRCTNKIEYGYHFDVKSGKLVGKELRGKKGGVAIPDKGSKYGSIHSHPTNGMSPPSAEDLVTFRCKQEDYHFMPSEHEIWYVKATDHFGMMGKLAQTDLVEAHMDCVVRGKSKVAKDIKKGILSADEDELRIALDKAVGDEILKTFNSPPWNKTITVKRYYR